jgi:hypothetical protein
MPTVAPTLLSEIWSIIQKKPDWSTSSFSLEKAYFCSLFSELAYEHVPAYELADRSRVKVVPCLAYQEIVRQGIATDVGVTLRGSEFVEFFVIERHYVIVVGVRTPDVVIVAIRGTKYLYDWKVNLNAMRHPLPHFGSTLHVHYGFFRAIASCFDALTEKLRGYVEDDVPIYVTGHSLGGAMAAILYAVWGMPRSYWMGRDATPIDSGYVFGMPKYGDLNTVTWLPIPHHIYNTEDIVPSVPPDWLGFAPCFTEYEATDKAIKALESRQGSNFVAWLTSLLTGSGIRGHNIELYVSRIRAQLP